MVAGLPVIPAHAVVAGAVAVFLIVGDAVDDVGVEDAAAGADLEGAAVVAVVVGERDHPEPAVRIPLGAVHVAEPVRVLGAMALGDCDGSPACDAGFPDIIGGATGDGETEEQEREKATHGGESFIGHARWRAEICRDAQDGRGRE